MNVKHILDHLEKMIAIESIALHGSLHKASIALNISQPSLSVKIKNLEEALNTKLLIRSTRGIQLTENGHKVYDYVQEIIRLTNQLQVVLSNADTGFQGVIRLGIYESIAKYFWPDCHAYFNKNFPDIKIQISVGRSQYLIQKILDQSIDAAITIEPIHHQQLISETLYHDQFGFYIHENLFKDCNKLNSDVNQCHQLFCFINALTEQGKPLSERLAQLKIPTNNVNEVESFEVAAEFCARQMGIAVLPTLIANSHPEHKHLKRLKIPTSKTDLFSKHRISITIPAKNKNHSLYETLTEQIKQQVEKKFLSLDHE